jgi:hypothetical protein
MGHIHLGGTPEATMSNLRTASAITNLPRRRMPRDRHPGRDGGGALDAVRGLASAVLLSVPLWALIGYAVSFTL